MKNMKKMKKAGLVAGIALAATVAFSATPKAAHATYLGTPTVSLTQPANPSAFETTVSTSTGSFTVWVTPTSTYGDTIPTPAQLSAIGVTGTIQTIKDATIPSNAPVFYNPSSLNLSYVAGITDPYTTSGGVTGEVQSNVFRVTSGSGAGDLVFTYQFDVLSTSPPGGAIYSASVAYFNEQLNKTTGQGYPWIIGDGINVNSSGTPIVLLGSNETGLSGTLAPNQGGVISTVSYDSTPSFNNSIYSIAENEPSNGYIYAGDASPQFFAASNATNYTLGSLSLIDNGGGGIFGGSVPVFVPDTPEPGTLVLFGTALGLLAFMVVRNRRSQEIA